MTTPMLELDASHAPQLYQMFPNASVTPAGLMQIPHDPFHTVLLRRLGYEVESPVLSQYHFPHPPHKPPFHVQKLTVEMLTQESHCYVLSGMGVGKTVCPLWAFDYLRRLGLAKRMLVTAPLSTLDFVWGREAFDFVPHLKVRVLHGDKAKRLKLLAEDADIYVINHDGVDVIHDALMARKDIDVFTIDELAEYRNSNPRSRRMQKFARKFTWVWGMTGSPTPKQPTDVWMQARIVTPDTVPEHFGRFREMTMIKVSQFKWLPKIDAQATAYAALQPSVRFTLEDVTELPEYISRRVDVAMGPTQSMIYKQIKDSCFAAINQQTITAANAGAALNKLAQISLGYVYSSSKGVVQLDNEARLDALEALINSSLGKVIIFTVFKHSQAGLNEFLLKIGRKAALINGDTSPKERGRIFNAFQNTDEYDTLNAHPECMAHGVTLTAADTVIWFGPTHDAEIYDQANHRIRRVGQKKKQQFLHIQSTPVEAKMYGALERKQNSHHVLLEMFREGTAI